MVWNELLRALVVGKCTDSSAFVQRCLQWSIDRLAPADMQCTNETVASRRGSLLPPQNGLLIAPPGMFARKCTGVKVTAKKKRASKMNLDSMTCVTNFRY